MRKKSLLLFLSIIISSMYGASAHAATLSIIPQKSQLSIGDELVVDVKLDTESKSANAAQATLQFPKNILAVKSIDKNVSVFNFWLDDPYVSAQNGTISFTAGSTNGFSGKSLEIVKVVFTVIGNGAGDIGLSSSAVTNADGTGANILFKVNSAHITSAVAGELPMIVDTDTTHPAPSEVTSVALVKPVQIERASVAAKNLPTAPVVEVLLYPDPADWYDVSANFHAKWNLPADITAVATAVTHDPRFAPTTSEGLFDDKIFEAPTDGIQYIHVRFKNNIGWGETAHYRLAIDTRPPLPFEIKVNEGASTDVPNPTITFGMGDQLSGIDRYDVSIDAGEAVALSKQSFQLPLLPPGDHKIHVVAWDKAKNSTVAEASLSIIPIASPIVSSISTDLFVGEGNLFASGTVSPAFLINAELKDEKGSLQSSVVITPDTNGIWSINLDKPLKRGKYILEFTSEDARGAKSFPVRETVTVRQRPLLTILGLDITPFWFYTFTSLLLIAALLSGIYIEKRKKEQRDRRIAVLERDISNILSHIKKDLSEISAIVAVTGNAKATYLVDHIKEEIGKIDTYIIDDIEHINH